MEKEDSYGVDRESRDACANLLCPRLLTSGVRRWLTSGPGADEMKLTIGPRTPLWAKSKHDPVRGACR
jgi:hypothetical protein